MFVEVDTAILVFKPFTGDTIRLPPIMDVSDRIDDPDHLGFYQYVVRKVALSTDPSLTRNNFQVAAIYGSYYSLAFMNCDDKSWTDTNFKGHVLFDVNCHKGSLYVVGYFCGVVSIDTSGRSGKKKRCCQMII